MFRHYFVVLRELVIGTWLGYARMLMQLLVIQFKFSNMLFFAIEISMSKHL